MEAAAAVPTTMNQFRFSLPLLLSVACTAIVCILVAAGLHGFGLFWGINAPAASPVEADTLAQSYTPQALLPNEAGVIPVLEYHGIVPDGVKAQGYEVTSAEFRSTMEELYEQNYRPINLTELVTGRIDCPAGTTPVVITFDDASKGQFDYTSDGQISPSCAVGMLLAMHQEHPDWPLKATFFVLPAKNSKFYFFQEGSSREKLQWLVANGFELGNHTVHHLPGMQSWPDQRVESEFAGGARMIDQNVPGYDVDLLALPFGVYPKNLNLVKHGVYKGLGYSNICAMAAGSGPTMPPFEKGWNAYKVQRIIPGKKRFMIDYWLNYLARNPSKRYISDGDPDTVTIPRGEAKVVSASRARSLGLELTVY